MQPCLALMPDRTCWGLQKPSLGQPAGWGAAHVPQPQPTSLCWHHQPGFGSAGKQPEGSCLIRPAGGYPAAAEPADHAGHWHCCLWVSQCHCIGGMLPTMACSSDLPGGCSKGGACPLHALLMLQIPSLASFHTLAVTEMARNSKKQ